MGWGNYFTFIFAAINTLTVTYYLAIQKIPTLINVFPTFIQYVLITSAVGVPILTGIGYVHFKKSYAYRAEQEISWESNPYLQRTLQNTETILPLYLKISEMLVKLAQNQKLTDKEISEVNQMQEKLVKHIEKKSTSPDFKTRVIGSDDD